MSYFLTKAGDNYMNSMEISNYLEKIRYGRKITQEDFVDGVVSLRQYQRYRSGECEITYEKIEQFATKLGIPAKKLMSEFEREKSIQSGKIDEYYSAIVNRDFETARIIQVDLSKDRIYGEERQIYYEHANVLLDFYQGRKSKVEALRISAELINYPTILKRNFFTDIEILIMSFILNVIEGSEQTKLLKKLTHLFENQDSILSGGNESIYSLILMRLSQIHGIHKNFPKVIELCNIGIHRSMIHRRFYLLEYFFYYQALAYFRLQEYTKYEDTLFRCYNVLHMEGNRKRIEKFTKLIESDFNIVYDTFIMKYLQKKIM